MCVIRCVYSVIFGDFIFSQTTFLPFSEIPVVKKTVLRTILKDEQQHNHTEK